jgi:hypothetical protein
MAERDNLPASSPFDPYPDYSSLAYESEYASVNECFLLPNSTARIPKLQAYTGVPRGFPDAVVGSYEVIGLRNDVCFERYGRLGPYGFGYGLRIGGTGVGLNGEREGAENVWEEIAEFDYRRVDWGEAQDRCIGQNSHRFRSANVGKGTRKNVRDDVNARASPSNHSETPVPAGKLLPRTAVVIRTWQGFNYREEHIIYLRSLITELSLHSGGEYTVHFLVQLKDENRPVWADDEVYQTVLQECLPKEFWGMATLWSEHQMLLIYGGLYDALYNDLPVHGEYRGLDMALQLFAYKHPEFDFFWHWEMDVRYTGHFYHLFEKLSSFAKKQARKELWERSGRFYIPAVHGSWEDFCQMVRLQTVHGTKSPDDMWNSLKHGHTGAPEDVQGRADRSIWGPERPRNDVLDTTDDPLPPTPYEKDKYEWGVGEEADLITLNPLFDPEGTEWSPGGDVTGYNSSQGLPPRRAACVVASRLSRRLLVAMHHETTIKKHHGYPEMWPAMVALHHGYKAVYAPHPVYMDREWPTEYLASIFNAGRNGASGGARASIFGTREHNFLGSTWYNNAEFAPNLWRRWLGLRTDNEGGEAYEVDGEGRMCLPAMLLHPNKEIELIIESPTTHQDE